MTGPDSSTVEIPLSGGNANAGAVVRVGDTVRRPAGPWTPAVHALLAHLHGVGFTGAPRPLGVDELGREVLSFAEGTSAWPDGFALLGPDRELARVGELVRAFHDAVTGFTPPPDARWQALIPANGAEIIAHHDLAPWNLVIGEPWVFIDWEAAAPGTRLWDVAYAVHGFVPLSPNSPQPGLGAGHRLRVFVDAYGLDEAERIELLGLLAPRTRSMVDFLAAQASAGMAPWAEMYVSGHGDAWRTDTEFIERDADRWRRALLD